MPPCLALLSQSSQEFQWANVEEYIRFLFLLEHAGALHMGRVYFYFILQQYYWDVIHIACIHCAHF